MKWTKASRPYPAAVYSCRTVRVGDRLFCFSGWTAAGSGTAYVYATYLNSNGEPVEWIRLKDLPINMRYGSVLFNNNTFYLVPFDKNAPGAVNEHTVWASDLNNGLSMSDWRVVGNRAGILSYGMGDCTIQNGDLVIVEPEHTGPPIGSATYKGHVISRYSLNGPFSLTGQSKINAGYIDRVIIANTGDSILVVSNTTLSYPPAPAFRAFFEFGSNGRVSACRPYVSAGVSHPLFHKTHCFVFARYSGGVVYPDSYWFDISELNNIKIKSIFNAPETINEAYGTVYNNNAIMVAGWGNGAGPEQEVWIGELET